MRAARASSSPKEPTISTLLVSTTFKEWLDATAGSAIPVGLSVNEAKLRAEALWRRFLEEDESVARIKFTPDLPDVLYGLVHYIAELPSDTADRAIRATAAIYEFVDRLEFSQDEFSEKDEFLVRFSFLAWNSCRRAWKYAEMKLWEQRCTASVLRDEAIAAFLALPIAGRSKETARRYLNDPAVLVAATVRFSAEQNHLPARVAAEAQWLFAWLQTNGSHFEVGDEVRHLAGEIALSAAVALKNLGRLAESEKWCDLAQQQFAKLVNPLPLKTKTDLYRLINRYELRQGAMVLVALPAVTRALEKCGMSRELFVARFLRGLALKVVGSIEEALECFELLSADVRESGDLLLVGLTLLNAGELSARLRDSETTSRYLEEALRLLEAAKSPLGSGQVMAVLGELRIAEGDLEGAITAFRSLVSIHTSAGLSFLAAYGRLVLASALVAAGREDQAVVEILEALPVIEREGAMVDAAAAVAVLRHSLTSRKLDHHALSKVREKLEVLRRGGEL